MLARRFTIVCLLITIFGMSLAILVAEKSRPTRAQAGPFIGCDVSAFTACPLPGR